MRVSVLVLDGVFDSGLSVVLDTLATANDLSESRRLNRYDVTLSGLARSATTMRGLQVPLTPVPARGGIRPDLVIVPALGCKTRETILQALERPDVTDACGLLRGWLKAGTRIAGACTATFVLAASGILDDGMATTTWWLSPLFRERFPAVALDDARMVVQSGRVVTAGAALAHLDLALWLVRQRSPSLAQATARYLVADNRPSQSVYVMPDHLAHVDPIVERFEHWARRHLKDFALASAAHGSARASARSNAAPARCSERLRCRTCRIFAWRRRSFGCKRRATRSRDRRRRRVRGRRHAAYAPAAEDGPRNPRAARTGAVAPKTMQRTTTRLKVDEAALRRDTRAAKGSPR